MVGGERWWCVVMCCLVICFGCVLAERVVTRRGNGWEACVRDAGPGEGIVLWGLGGGVDGGQARCTGASAGADMGLLSCQMVSALFASSRVGLLEGSS